MYTEHWRCDIIEWKRLSRNDSELISNQWEEDPDFEKWLNEWKQTARGKLPTDYQIVRGRLLGYYEEVKDNPDLESSKYLQDLEFGLNMYSFLSKELGMTSAIASDDDMWRYLQMKILPDMVFDRWGPTDKEKINKERFWQDKRRLWMKSLWWYIHLSFQNDSLDETRKILYNNSVDEISQLVERPGTGYRVDLCRAIMKRYSQSPKHHHELLRNVMKLNTVRCITTEPLLFESGMEEYVEELFRYYDA